MKFRQDRVASRRQKEMQFAASHESDRHDPLVTAAAGPVGIRARRNDIRFIYLCHRRYSCLDSVVLQIAIVKSNHLVPRLRISICTLDGPIP